MAVRDSRPLLRIGEIHHSGLRSALTQRLSTNKPSYFETAVIRPRHLSDRHRGFISLSVFLFLSLSLSLLLSTFLPFYLSTFLSLYLWICGYSLYLALFHESSFRLSRFSSRTTDPSNPNRIGARAHFWAKQTHGSKAFMLDSSQFLIKKRFLRTDCSLFWFWHTPCF